MFGKSKAGKAIEARRRTRRLTIRGVLSFFIIVTLIRSIFMQRYSSACCRWCCSVCPC